MSFLQATKTRRRRLVYQNKQKHVTFFQEFSPWIFEVQQTFSLKWLRQTLITTKKGRDYVSLKTSEKNLKVTLLYNAPPDL